MKRRLDQFRNIWKMTVLFILVMITFSYAMFQGGFVSWFLFFGFLPFAMYGLCLVFYKLKEFEIERIFLKKEFNAGESLQIQIKIKRFSSFPLFYLILEDSFSDSSHFLEQKDKIRTLLFPGFRKELLFEYIFDNVPRGEHILKEIRIKTGDLLGLIEKEKVIPIKDRIVVYPAYEDIQYRPLANHYDQGMTASKERVQRDTSMAIGIRDYEPGDRFSWINWKATAKRGDIMTKEFEQRQSHDVYIVMDCSADSRFEAVVSFTASIIRGILRKGAQVGFLSVSQERIAFPIRSGQVHQQQLFYHLAKIKNQTSVTMDKVLDAETFLTQQSVSLMVVTAQITHALVEKVGFLAQKNGVVTIFLVKDEKESPTKNEISLMASANARGGRVVLVHEGHFSDAFSEVKRG